MIYALYKYGLYAGLILITSALSWDLVTKGIGSLFCFWKYSIGYKGAGLILIGLLLILAHIRASKKIIVGNLYNYKHIPDGKLR